VRAPRLPAAALLALAAGCAAAGPDYEPPRAEVPEAWRDAGAEGTAGGPADLAAWWRRFGDPVLDHLVERAIGQGLDLREALARVREARALRGGAAADRFPTVDGVVSYRRSGESDETAAGAFAGDSDFFSAGLDAAWEVDLWGRVRRSVEAADAGLDASVEDARAVLVTVAAETALRYVELRAFRRRLAVSRGSVALQEESLALARARFETGLAGERDVSQARTSVETTRARIPALEAGARAAENRLAVLLGRPPGDLAEALAADRPIPAPPPEVAVGVPADLLRRRADVRRAERLLAAETARIGVAEADLYPRLVLLGRIGVEAEEAPGLGDAGSDAFSVGPSIRWNLFDGGRARSRIGAQDARAEQALVRWERAVLAALEEAENAMTAFARERERRRLLSEAYGEAARTADLARTQYAEGLSDFQVVVDSQRVLSLLADDLAVSEAAVAANLVALYKALGGGWESAPPGAPGTAPAD
jgi:NodT family efflux transporter outer membrane factor (OMF) lipoprotein